MLSDLRYRLRALFHRDQLEQELDEELQFHLARAAEKYGKPGQSSEKGDRIARQLFGGVEQTRERCRDSRGTRGLEDLLQDCRYAIRMIRKNVVFSALIVLVLGLGIGANTAIFSIVHAVILKPLPFRDPARLLAVWDTYFPQFSRIGVSPVELNAWQAQVIFSKKQLGFVMSPLMEFWRLQVLNPSQSMQISFRRTCFRC
jgi:putative ABC transport system permease protein